MLYVIIPIKKRKDAAGALHHIICRGIKCREIFNAEADRLEIAQPAAGRLAQKRETPAIRNNLFLENKSNGLIV
jgi:hypothetical protein